MWKFRYIRKMVPKPLNFRTITILADGNGKNRNRTLCSAINLDFENPDSPVPFPELNKTNLKNYQFPIMKISYNQRDVVEHAKSIGVQFEEKFADSYLNEWNKKLQVLPSFIFPFSNKVLLDLSLSNPSVWMSFYKTVHREHYIQQLRELPAEGIINLEIKTLDVLDKASGTLYCFNMTGYDENGEAYFKTEYQMFEVGTGGFNGNISSPYLTRIVEPNNSSIPDSILEFPTFVPDDGYKAKMSDSDMQISAYSPLYPRQYYSNQYEFISNPVAHGRYTFAGIINLILFKYGDGNVANFKSAKVRFTEPVAPGEIILISTWNEDSRILFQGNVQRNEKTIKVLTGGYIDLNL